MTKLSAIIITLNEERNIGRCLQSLEGIADEVIVVDSFSTDRTKEISISKGAIVIEHEWSGYGNTKNFGVTNAKYDYILSIDADECLSDELKQSVIEAKEKGLTGVYEFKRLTNYCGKWIRHCGWYPDKKIRLYPKQSAAWNNDIIHERLIVQDNVAKTFLNGDLEHYSFYTVDEHWNKAMKYAKLGAQKIRHQSRLLIYAKMILNPFFIFTKMYFFQLGFLDGYYGFVICMISAHSSFVKYVCFLSLKKNSAVVL